MFHVAEISYTIKFNTFCNAKPTGKYPTRIIKGINFTNWAEGEPSCKRTYRRNSTQSCLALKLDKEENYKWGALGCESELSFICELYV